MEQKVIKYCVALPPRLVYIYWLIHFNDTYFTEYLIAPLFCFRVKVRFFFIYTFCLPKDKETESSCQCNEES